MKKFFLLIIVATLFFSFFWYFYHPLPKYKGHISIGGLNKAVDIYTDNYGVPHIFAQNEEDLFYAAGYFAARERLFQMSIVNYSVRGELAYALGDEIDEATKEARYSRLTQLQERIATEANDAFIGTRQMVLVDAQDGEIYYARMERDAPEIDGQVIIDEGRAEVGDFAEVEITASMPYQLSGRVVGKLR